MLTLECLLFWLVLSCFLEFFHRVKPAKAVALLTSVSLLLSGLLGLWGWDLLAINVVTVYASMGLILSLFAMGLGEARRSTQQTNAAPRYSRAALIAVFSYGSLCFLPSEGVGLTQGLNYSSGLGESPSVFAQVLHLLLTRVGVVEAITLNVYLLWGLLCALLSLSRNSVEAPSANSPHQLRRVWRRRSATQSRQS